VKFKRLKTALSNIVFTNPVQVKFRYMTVKVVDNIRKRGIIYHHYVETHI